MSARLLLVLVLACTGCDILGPSSVPLDLETRLFPRRNLNLSVDSNDGFAGLRVGLSGAVTDSFTASDFPVASFPVPFSGIIHITVFLYKDDELVAKRRVDWPLRSDVTKWKLEVYRSPNPGIATLDNVLEPEFQGDPRCGWVGCHRIWHIGIVEEARNYSDEALWLVLWKYDESEYGCRDPSQIPCLGSP